MAHEPAACRAHGRGFLWPINGFPLLNALCVRSDEERVQLQETIAEVRAHAGLGADGSIAHTEGARGDGMVAVAIAPFLQRPDTVLRAPFGAHAWHRARTHRRMRRRRMWTS